MHTHTPQNMNFKLKNKIEIKHIRNNYLQQQEIEKVKYIENINNEAKIREKNKNYLIQKQVKKQEMMMQPLE